MAITQLGMPSIYSPDPSFLVRAWEGRITSYGIRNEQLAGPRSAMELSLLAF